MQALSRILFVIGILCIATYGFVAVQAHLHQQELSSALEKELALDWAGNPEGPAPRFSEGDLLGKLEIPRLRLSVMMMEGVAEETLRLGGGHIPGTAYPGAPGNSGFAAHRDTFFSKLRKVRKDDVIQFTTRSHTVSYRVASTAVVNPSDTRVLRPTSSETITLVTCFPFYYIGPAPKRFVVHAVRASA
jgi:LPXTG-site transpeptidase (sortase) family protein